VYDVEELHLNVFIGPHQNGTSYPGKLRMESLYIIVTITALPFSYLCQNKKRRIILN